MIETPILGRASLRSLSSPMTTYYDYDFNECLFVHAHIVVSDALHCECFMTNDFFIPRMQRRAYWVHPRSLRVKRRRRCCVSWHSAATFWLYSMLCRCADTTRTCRTNIMHIMYCAENTNGATFLTPGETLFTVLACITPDIFWVAFSVNKFYFCLWYCLVRFPV